jgi:tRNA dimethylallyltransferase
VPSTILVAPLNVFVPVNEHTVDAFRKINAVRLEHDRSVLVDRISRRARQMLQCGWVEEAQRAIAAGLLESPTAHQALGYKIIKRYLDGEFDLAKLEELIVTATWQYARRQRTWFRHQSPVPDEIIS